MLVDLEMPTPAVFEGPGACWNRSAKCNIARVKRGRFEFDVLKGNGWVTEFYRDMYKPSMLSRYGPRPMWTAGRALAQLARTPGTELLRVLLDGNGSPGTSIGPRRTATGREARLDGRRRRTPQERRRVSWVWFNFRVLRLSAISAFSSAPSSRTSKMACFSTRANGVDGFPANGRYFGEFRFLLEPSHPVCRQFLQAHSILTRGTDRGFIVFSGRGPDAVDISPEVLRGIKRWYTWRDRPLSVPEITSEEVPRQLQPWLTVREV